MTREEISPRITPISTNEYGRSAGKDLASSTCTELIRGILYKMKWLDYKASLCETLRNLCALCGLLRFYREGRRVYAKLRKGGRCKKLLLYPVDCRIRGNETRAFPSFHRISRIELIRAIP